MEVLINSPVLAWLQSSTSFLRYVDIIDIFIQESNKIIHPRSRHSISLQKEISRSPDSEVHGMDGIVVNIQLDTFNIDSTARHI